MYGYLFFQGVLLSTFKVGYILSNAIFLQIFNLLLLLLIILYFLINITGFNFYKLPDYQKIYFVSGLIFSSLSSFFFVVDLVFFLLNLELVTIIFYMFFLVYFNNEIFTLIKYKNLLSSYLWGTFFATFFLFLVLISFVILCGSLNFIQIKGLYLDIPSFVWNFLLISFM
jgi:hypothetical protein